MPMTDRSGESNPDSASPGQALSCCEAGGASDADDALSEAAAILSVRPSQPPTRCRPISVSGSSEATMTKNCSTSL